MRVHNILGNEFQEVIYQRCLAIELEKQGIQFLREQPMPICYDESAVGKRRADFIVENSVLIELEGGNQIGGRPSGSRAELPGSI